MLVSDLETPALLIDVEVMERNLTRLAAYTRDNGLRLRPHTKTHKIPELARRQLELGAAGLTVAKVGEAEAMLAAAPGEILVGYPIVGASKVRRLAEVGRRSRVTVAVDSVEAANELSEGGAAAGVEFGVLVELDAGYHRVGVAPGAVLRNLCAAIRRLAGLRFEGLSFFPGHIHTLDDAGRAAIGRVNELLDRSLEDVRSEGLAARIVSGGNTPIAQGSHLFRHLNEIRSGTYIFNDRNTVSTGACGFEDCAASVLSTVVSTAVEGQAVLDAGSKTLAFDAHWGPEGGYGHIVQAPQARLARMNEEHGWVDMAAAGRKFKVGDRVHVIPNHICPVMNLHDRVYGICGDRVEQVWTVAARGRVQ